MHDERLIVSHVFVVDCGVVGSGGGGGAVSVFDANTRMLSLRVLCVCAVPAVPLLDDGGHVTCPARAAGGIIITFY